MARPVGQFNRSKEKLFQLVRDLAGLGKCFATTKFLASRLNRSEPQVKRYLAALIAERKLTVSTSSRFKDQRTGKSFRKRFIRISANLAPAQIIKSSYIPLPIVEPAVLPNYHDELHEAYLRMVEEDRVKAERRAFYDTLDPDYEFKQAAMRELELELASMEQNNVVSP